MVQLHIRNFKKLITMDNYIRLIGKNVPSSKNSKQITKSGKIISSKLTREYVKWALPLLIEQKEKWDFLTSNLQPPYKIGFKLFRDSARRYDFINIIQVLADLLVKVGYIIDDNTKNFIPYYLGEEVVDDKKLAGVYIFPIITI